MMASNFFNIGHNIENQWQKALGAIFTWNRNHTITLLVFDGEGNACSALSHFMIMHPFALNFVDDGRNPKLTMYFSVRVEFLPPLNDKRCIPAIQQINIDDNLIGLHWHKHRKNGTDRVVIYPDNLWNFGYPVFRRIYTIKLYTETIGVYGIVHQLERGSWDYIEKTNFNRFADLRIAEVKSFQR